MNITRKRRLAEGKCISCEREVKPNAEGKRPQRCPKCQGDLVAANRRRAEAAKAAGKCPLCRRRKLREGYARCWKCTYASRGQRA